MKFLYCLRVFFISCEFAFLLFGLAIYIYFGEILHSTFMRIPTVERAKIVLIGLQIGLFVYNFKDGMSIILPDDHTSKVLRAWPDFWKLEMHFNVGIFNTIIFFLPCLFVWLMGFLNEFEGLWIFLIFSIAASINTLSFYYAKINVRSALIRSNF